MPWGHDEYLYQVLSSQTKLPEEALQAIRSHSLYPLPTAKEPVYMALVLNAGRRLNFRIRKFA